MLYYSRLKWNNVSKHFYFKFCTELRGVCKNMKGVSKHDNEILLIHIHDIHTSIHRFVSQTCGVLISCGIGSLVSRPLPLLDKLGEGLVCDVTCSTSQVEPW